MTSRLARSALLSAALACAAAPAFAQEAGQALGENAPVEAFGEYSYYDAYPKMDANDLIDVGLWTTCWAFTEAEKDRLDALAEQAPNPELADEMKMASIHYQVAEIYYGELVRGTAIFNGEAMGKVNSQREIEQQSLIGGAPQWIAKNAADCIWKMPDRDMPEFAELYPWLASGFGTTYRN